jgi:general secretion pathway protein G
VNKLLELDFTKRGDEAKAVWVPGRRVTLCRVGPAAQSCAPAERGFSLIELVVTISVMTILTFSVIPLLKVSVKRQKEQQLRAALRQMRTAIDEFRRDTVGMQCTGAGGQMVPGPSLYVDPRSKVVVSDCTIFGVDNPDRYPPDLETLVSGVNVIPRATGSNLGDPEVNATAVAGPQLSTKKKVYLRSIPIDPITGEADWDLRSCYDSADAGSWGGENVFDVRSKSKATALNGEKYSDW